ncbi:hypothetical protein PCANC_24081 [Puccinia coronata f. sp. avenae]|uniref:Uncharacterized protein n=1 Tax=Puccinia coronata f. sp. avenae TaxID=200324 RepID=A0A2N5UHH6_9BASI|nr:hypothetical protein PCANC_24081 [Puccinia coronata f. sp. avenae]
MPSHLRNGKDLSFEQLHASKIAAERKAERARQQQRLVEIAGRQGASEQPSANNHYGPNELPSSVNCPTPLNKPALSTTPAPLSSTVPLSSLLPLATEPTNAQTQQVTGALPRGILLLAIPSAPQL